MKRSRLPARAARGDGSSSARYGAYCSGNAQGGSGASEAGEIPALSRNGDAPQGDEPGRLSCVGETCPRSKGGSLGTFIGVAAGALGPPHPMEDHMSRKYWGRAVMPAIVMTFTAFGRLPLAQAEAAGRQDTR
jgi:hypothetical protein